MATLLEKARKLNKILEDAGTAPVNFTTLSESLREVLDSNTYVISAKGKVIGVSLKDDLENPIIIDPKTGDKNFPIEYNEKLLNIDVVNHNVTGDGLLDIFSKDIKSYDKYATIVPLKRNGERLGTLVLARAEEKFTEDDLVLVEYSATIVATEILRSKSEVVKEKARKKSIVQMGIKTLSYSELEALTHIFEELDGEEGLLVASKVADRVGITRSVIVNALRKLESAGIIESRSLGMKGTYIKILNDKLLEELDKIKR
ncbi:GTP-sensing pleiotropic transcriptional regulator CodY [Clostridium sp. D2Q-14]|uniref:GTP-sensing pleiotropic transcriptional regulator CodY n=1 Tax=Anaeromonas gelatinilytica TaxID=2683194 RepID=UPI00193B53FB|nr:GTP-sensing pleiotropic transcriptional regulator CodY [Anaeromonas gelatinilytica]MBS4536558.1 GTP-sensing pleiotropic transcriptional regulator CodY [Anaeromonas gelatinilytica]